MRQAAQALGLPAARRGNSQSAAVSNTLAGCYMYRRWGIDK